MNKNEATYRAIQALKTNGELMAARVLEDSLKITGNCQYCAKQLETQIELITLCDCCEECSLIESIHPAKLERLLPKMLKVYESE